MDFSWRNISSIEDNTSLHSFSFVILVIGFLLLFINIAISNSVGIGGGPGNIVILVYFFACSEFESIAYSRASIFGGSLATTLIKMTMKNPKYANFPLMNYELIAYAGPMLIAGAQIGSILSRIIQEWIAFLLLSILVALAFFMTLKKGLKLYKEESIAFSKGNNLEEILIKNHEAPSNIGSYFLILLSIFIIVVFEIVTDEKILGKYTGFIQCTEGYFTMIGLYFFFTALQVVLTSIYLEKKYRNNYSGDITWTKDRLIMFFLISIFLGTLTGFLGIGGGIIINPLLLNYGLSPEVTAACANFFELLSSISSVLQLISADLISIKELVTLSLLSAFASFIGTLFLKKLLMKYKRPSIIVLTIGFLLFLVTIMIPINLIKEIYSEIKDSSFSFDFKSIC